jgi:hypothetical protein
MQDNDGKGVFDKAAMWLIRIIPAGDIPPGQDQ